MGAGKHQLNKNEQIHSERVEQPRNSRQKKVKKNRKHQKMKAVIRLIFILVFIACVGYIAYYYISSYEGQKETTELLNQIEIEEPVQEETEKMAKLKKLQKDNPEIIGWLEIDGTKINYPVMQGTDNDFYMDHNYKKEKNKQGSLFLDKAYDWTIPSNNFLIYGHNNTLDGSMFADLLKYEKESFYKKHPTLQFTTTKEDCEYEIIAAFRSRVYYKSETNVFRYYYFFNATTEQEYNDFVANSKKASLYDTGKTATYGDQLITLSTCAYHTEDGRFAVVARKAK